MFDWAKFLWQHDPTFQQGIRRVVGYFLTDLEYYDPTHKAELESEDISSYRQLLEGKLNIRYALYQILTDYCLYGNVIISMLPPIERRLECPACRLIHPLSVLVSDENPEFRFKYHPNGVRFEATCQRCKTRGDWGVYDVPGDYRKNLCINIYDNYNFIIECDQFSDRRLYTWNIPADLRNAVKEGNPLRLLHTPLSVLRAIGEDKPYRFNDGVLLHLREPEVVGFDLGGWGIPQAMFCYGPSRYAFGLRKMNEVITSDYLVPMRVLTPEKAQESGGGFSESGMMDMADWNRQIGAMIARHKKDPASIHSVPFPLQYQVLGGEGKSLALPELLTHAEEIQLNAMGIPVHLHRGDITLQDAPMAARLFEAHWKHIPAAANEILKWVVDKITPRLGWKEFGVKLTPPKMADNLDQLMLLLQMMQAGEVTATTILAKLGLDRAEEKRRQMDESVQDAKMQAKASPEMDKIVAGNTALPQAVEQQRAMMEAPMGGEGGALQGGGMPAAADPLAEIMAKIEAFGNPNVPISPVEMFQIAQEAAVFLAGMEEGPKRQKLREIDKIHEPMGAMIRKQLDAVHRQRREQFEEQGAAMAAQQEGGMPPPM
jgi:hypothetical protein